MNLTVYKKGKKLGTLGLVLKSKTSCSLLVHGAKSRNYRAADCVIALDPVNAAATMSLGIREEKWNELRAHLLNTRCPDMAMDEILSFAAHVRDILD